MLKPSPKHTLLPPLTSHLTQPHPRAPPTLIAVAAPPTALLCGSLASPALPHDHEPPQEDDGQERAEEGPDDNAGGLGL